MGVQLSENAFYIAYALFYILWVYKRVQYDQSRQNSFLEHQIYEPLKFSQIIH